MGSTLWAQGQEQGDQGRGDCGWVGVQPEETGDIYAVVGKTDILLPMESRWGVWETERPRMAPSLWPELLGGDIYENEKAAEVWGLTGLCLQAVPSPPKPKGLPAGMALLDHRP